MTHLDIARPVLWLDATEITATGENGAVMCWPDRSGYRFDAVYRPFVINWNTCVRTWHQPPTLAPAAINGLPAVSFNALLGQTLLLVEAGGAIDRRVEGFTLCCLARSRLIQPQTGNKYLFISHNRENHAGEEPEAGNTRFAVMRNGETGWMRMHVRAAKRQAGRVCEAESGPAQFGDMEWGVSTFLMDYAANRSEQRYNGRLIAAHDMPGPRETEDFNSPVVAIASTSEGNYLTCDIAELICFGRAVENSELATIEIALLDKYAIVP